MSCESMSFQQVTAAFIPATSCAHAPVSPPQIVWLSDCSSMEHRRIVVADAGSDEVQAIAVSWKTCGLSQLMQLISRSPLLALEGQLCL